MEKTFEKTSSVFEDDEALIITNTKTKKKLIFLGNKKDIH